MKENEVLEVKVRSIFKKIEEYYDWRGKPYYFVRAADLFALGPIEIPGFTNKLFSCDRFITRENKYRSSNVSNMEISLIKRYDTGMIRGADQYFFLVNGEKIPVGTHFGNFDLEFIRNILDSIINEIDKVIADLEEKAKVRFEEYKKQREQEGELKEKGINAMLSKINNKE